MDLQKHWNDYFSLSVNQPFDINNYSNGSKYLIKELKNVIKPLDLINKNILDVGGGTGDILKYFFPKSNLHLVDISSKALMIAKKNDINTHLINIETDKLPYKDNFFDFVLSSEVIEHLKDHENFFAEIKRVLKPRGLFLITTPNICSLSSRIRLIFGFLPTTASFDPDHIQILNFQKLISILKKSGFKVIQKTTDALFIPTFKLFPIPILHHPTLGEHIILLSQK